jgi:chemotaxis protein histidine kinase CheA
MTREDILRALRSEFRDNTRSRLVAMNGLLEQLRREPDSARLRELERHFHGLAGLGGTYGYSSVTSASREGETICEDGLSSPDAVDHEQLAGILAEISRAIEEVPDNE